MAMFSNDGWGTVSQDFGSGLDDWYDIDGNYNGYNGDTYSVPIDTTNTARPSEANSTGTDTLVAGPAVPDTSGGTNFDTTGIDTGPVIPSGLGGATFAVDTGDGTTPTSQIPGTVLFNDNSSGTNFDTTGIDTGPVIPTGADTTTVGAAVPTTDTTTTTGGSTFSTNPADYAGDAATSLGTNIGGGENNPGAFGDTIPTSVINAAGPNGVVTDNGDGTYRVFDTVTGTGTDVKTDGTNVNTSTFNPRVDVTYVDPTTGQVVTTRNDTTDTSTTLGGLLGTGASDPNASTSPFAGTGSTASVNDFIKSNYGIIGTGGVATLDANGNPLPTITFVDLNPANNTTTTTLSNGVTVTTNNTTGDVISSTGVPSAVDPNTVTTPTTDTTTTTTTDTSSSNTSTDTSGGANNTASGGSSTSTSGGSGGAGGGGSAGYEYAKNNQGLDSYYQAIRDFMSGNPSQQQILDAMATYGVSQADINAAISTTNGSNNAGSVTGSTTSVTGSNNGSVTGSVTGTTSAVGSVTGTNTSATGSTVGSVTGSTSATGSTVGSTTGSVVGSTVGSVTGSTVGSVVGSTTGNTSGSVTGSTTGTVGSATGSVTGSTTGSVVGSTTGSVVGSTVGSVVGSVTGSTVGSVTGSTTGSVTGSTTGSVTGSTTGSVVGSTVGSVVGSTVGSVIGSVVGSTVGSTVGSVIGSVVGSTTGSVTGSTTGSVTGNLVVGSIGKGLNPGWIRPSEFYKTNDPAQSKFNWGAHGYQIGPLFDDRAYNQAAGSNTPWGLQQLAKPLTSEDINNLIAGKSIASQSVPAATRKEAYNPASMITPTAENTYQLKPVAPPAASTSAAAATTDAQYQAISDKLGSNWFNRQQAAAAAGDWDTYNQIQQQVNAILNPVIERY